MPVGTIQALEVASEAGRLKGVVDKRGGAVDERMDNPPLAAQLAHRFPTTIESLARARVKSGRPCPFYFGAKTL